MESSALVILHLIESVDPTDTDALDNVDKRFYYYLFPVDKTQPPGRGPSYDIPEFTRSRDALKAVRDEHLPEWKWYASSNAGLHSFVLHDGDHNNEMLGEVRSTECLAELHAIIQAIEWIKNDE